jgi:small subunit ribosomal protein S1
VHISELASHHVENPREVVAQGQAVNVRILEIDGDRRRLSLSLKRVEEGEQPVPRADGAESVHETPNLVLSEEAFPATGAPAAEAPESEGIDPPAKPEAQPELADTEAAGHPVDEPEVAPEPDAEPELGQAPEAPETPEAQPGLEEEPS